MPIYRYRCETCGHEFEDLGKFEESEKPCGRSELGLEMACTGTAKRIPSIPAPAQFNCSMPTYQKPKT